MSEAKGNSEIINGSMPPEIAAASDLSKDDTINPISTMDSVADSMKRLAVPFHKVHLVHQSHKNYVATGSISMSETLRKKKEEELTERAKSENKSVEQLLQESMQNSKFKRIDEDEEAELSDENQPSQNSDDQTSKTGESDVSKKTGKKAKSKKRTAPKVTSTKDSNFFQKKHHHPKHKEIDSPSKADNDTDENTSNKYCDSSCLLRHVKNHIRTEKMWIDRESQTDDILAEPSLVEKICQDHQNIIENIFVYKETQSDNFLEDQPEEILGEIETLSEATQTEIVLRDEHSQTEYTDKFAAKRHDFIQSRKLRFSSKSQSTEDNHLLVNALPGIINKPLRVLFDKDLKFLRYCINGGSRENGVYLSAELIRRTQKIVTEKMLNELTEKVEIYSGVYLREVELFNENEKLIVGKLTIAARTILPFEYSKLSCDQGTTILCLLKGTAILKSSVQKPGQDILASNPFLPKSVVIIQSGAPYSIENYSCVKAQLFYYIQPDMEKLGEEPSST